MGSFNFKASGRTKEQTLVEALNASAVPIGLKTPLRLGLENGLFAMHTSLADQLHDNLRNLLLTNHGERLGLYGFGANLRPLTTELHNLDDFDAEAVKRINEAVARWMPFISLDNFLSTVDKNENDETGIIKVTVTYTIPALQAPVRALEVTLYVI